MDPAVFSEDWNALLRPELDEDGHFPHEYPVNRLTNVHGLNFSYFQNEQGWEGSSVHPFTRLCPKDHETVHALTRNQDVPERLFESALRLFADSIVLRASETVRAGELRYYPPVILTFWSGFETFVRRSSELMIATVRNIPEPVVNYLQEREAYVAADGTIKRRSRFQSVLDRYALLLQYGYNWSPARGNKFWQDLVAAKKLRDYYTHLDVSEPREISAGEVLKFMEAVLLAIIWPSSELQRSLLLGVYRSYEQWEFLSERAQPFVEKPFFLDWTLKREYLFHCNFENVNDEQFPSMDQRLTRRGGRAN